MTDYSAADVRLMLARHGLDSDVFDPEEIAADLTNRTELNDGLDDLLDHEVRADPTGFDPEWLL